MEIIDEQEPNSRGAYAGAVGYFSFISTFLRTPQEIFAMFRKQVQV